MNTVLVEGKIVKPSKVICIGRNYMEHVHELGNDIPTEQVVFIKPNSAISSVLQSFHGEQLHYEGEICFIYQEGTFSHVGFGLDLTKRELQSSLKKQGLPWERAKAFDGSALFSEFVPIDEIEAISINLIINDELRQEGDLNQMFFKPLTVLKNIQDFMSLENGDIVMTGTPKGVGKITKNDHFVGSIQHRGHTIAEASWLAE